MKGEIMEQKETVIEKNTQEVIKVGMTEFGGDQFVSMRVFFKTHDGLIPTKKGLTLRPEVAVKVYRALQGLVPEAGD